MLFFTDTLIENASFRPDNDDQHHMYALRPRVGDMLTVSDGKSLTAPAAITAADKKGFTVTIGKPQPIRNVPLPTVLLLALLKGDRLETAIQKCTELGVTEVILYTSENCVATAEAKEEAKLERCRRVVKTSAMQCGNPLLTKISGILRFADAVNIMKENSGLFFYENAEKLLSVSLKERTSAPDRPVYIMTGPEGGFTSAEVDKMIKAGIEPLSLGKLILRAETAPVCVISVLRAFRGEI